MAQGVVQMSRFSVLYAPLDGRLERAVLGQGQTVAAGTPLMWFDATALKLDIEQALRERDELLAMERASLSRQSVDLQPLVEQRLAKDQRVLELKSRLDKAVLRAPHEGRYVALEGAERQGAWLGQGAEVGHVLDPSQGYAFVAVVSQESARELFASPVGEINLRVLGQADQLIEVERVVMLPYQLDRLPSAALGWLGGGDLAVSNQDAKGEKAAEEFFEVRLTLKPDSAAGVVLAHGMRGLLRVQRHQRVVAGTRAFDLDHVGPEIAQQLRAARTCENARKVEHAKTGQRQSGHGQAGPLKRRGREGGGICRLARARASFMRSPA
jgi:putative peptide zinc metalloprotease protein